MTYPLSSPVTAGDATLASHHNNLLLDAVYLGQSSDDAVALGAALERYATRLEIEKISAAAVRVPASATAPVSLVIQGFLCQAVANVDLAGGEAPAGVAAPYYVFANRADDSTTFTLTVSTIITQGANQRRIGRFYWDGSAIVKDSVRSEFAGYIADLLFFVDPQICNGRLTLSTGVPIPDSDVISSANVYFTNYLGNRVAFYVKDYGWRLYSFSELTLDISGLGGDTNYDIWLYDNEGTLTLAYTAWSNAILRATALALQDGVYVKSGSPAYRYLGSIRTSGAGVTADTLLKRFVWNNNNRVNRFGKVQDTTDQWTYDSATVRQANAAAANMVEFIIGLSENVVVSHFLEVVKLDTDAAIRTAFNGIGLDATDALAADSTRAMSNFSILNQAYVVMTNSVLYSGFPGIGYHYLCPLEWTAGLVTYYGDEDQLFTVELIS